MAFDGNEWQAFAALTEWQLMAGVRVRSLNGNEWQAFAALTE